MKKRAKVFFILLGLVMFVALGGALAAYLFVDPNDYREEVVSLVREATGRELVFEGRMSLSFVPGPGIRTGPVRLGNPEGFDSPDFLAASDILIRVEPWMILSWKMSARRIVLVRPKINLIRREDGEVNWNFPRGESKGDAGLPAVSVGSIRVRRAEINYNDMARNQTLSLSEIELRTGRVVLSEAGSPTRIRLSGRLAGTNPGIQGKFKLEAHADFDPARQFLNLELPDFTGRVQGGGLPGTGLDFSLSGEFGLDLKEMIVSMAGARFTGGGLRLSAQSGKLALEPALNLRAGLRLEPSNPRLILSALGGDPGLCADPSALTEISGDLDLDLAPGSLSKADIRLRLDQTDLNGTAEFRPSLNPALIFALQAGEFDLDRCLGGSDGPSARMAPNQGNQTIPLPGFLEELSCEGSVRANALTIGGITFNDIEMRVAAGKGGLSIEPLTGR